MKRYHKSDIRIMRYVATFFLIVAAATAQRIETPETVIGDRVGCYWREQFPNIKTDKRHLLVYCPKTAWESTATIDVAALPRGETKQDIIRMRLAEMYNGEREVSDAELAKLSADLRDPAIKFIPTDDPVIELKRLGYYNELPSMTNTTTTVTVTTSTTTTKRKPVPVPIPERPIR